MHLNKIRRTPTTNNLLYETKHKFEGEPETVLLGWTYTEIALTDLQNILSVYRELSIHLPGLTEKRRWAIAGNCVARIVRDNKER